MTTPEPSGLTPARVATEQAWAHARWLERLSFAQMRVVAQLPPDEGGLGYTLSESALRGLVTGAREARGDISMSREERIERHATEVDARARAARRDLEAAERRARKLDEVIEGFTVYDKDDARELSGLIAKREAIAADLAHADRRLDAVHAREAKLFGLDQPTEAKLEVVSRDGIIDDLNAALERMGEAPVEVER